MAKTSGDPTQVGFFRSQSVVFTAQDGARLIHQFFFMP
jgi:hypothetical protein